MERAVASPRRTACGSTSGQPTTRKDSGLTASERTIVRKLSLLITLAVASVLFLAATPNPASAANCNVNTGVIYYELGAWAVDPSFTNCTNVIGVRVQGYEYGTHTGILWPARGRDFATSTATITFLSQVGPWPTWIMTFRTPVFGQGCGAGLISVRPHFYWQIKNAVGGTWGSWYQNMGAYQSIC